MPSNCHGAAAERVFSVLPGLSDAVCRRSLLHGLLNRPIEIAGRPVRFRFAAQRSWYLERVLDVVQYRGRCSFRCGAPLLKLPRVGPQTASWIVRNRRSSSEVAILDVHIVRACKAMGSFPRTADPARHYLELQQRFFEFCRVTGLGASSMDAVMWRIMSLLAPRCAASDEITCRFASEFHCRN
jgi:hypothetical protein